MVQIYPKDIRADMEGKEVGWKGRPSILGGLLEIHEAGILIEAKEGEQDTYLFEWNGRMVCYSKKRFRLYQDWLDAGKPDPIGYYSDKEEMGEQINMAYKVREDHNFTPIDDDPFDDDDDPFDD